MELEGLSRALKFLTNKSIEVGTLITDRHKQVSKFVREQHPHIDRRYDVWHVSKGIACKHLQLLIVSIHNCRHQK